MWEPELSQQLRELAALPENPSSIPRTHVGSGLTSFSNSSSDLMPSTGPHGLPVQKWCTDIPSTYKVHKN